MVLLAAAVGVGAALATASKQGSQPGGTAGVAATGTTVEGQDTLHILDPPGLDGQPVVAAMVHTVCP